LEGSLQALVSLTPELAAAIRRQEERTDRYEDLLSTYLVQLSARPISAEDNAEAAKLLKLIGDFERIADHAVNLLRSAEEMTEKHLTPSPTAMAELDVLSHGVEEILQLALTAFAGHDLAAAAQVEPLEQVIDQLKEQMRTRHIRRMQQGVCSIEAGFVWSDLLTDLERTADHCSNIAACVTDLTQYNLNLHESLRALRSDSQDFRQCVLHYAQKYALPQG
jgi:phosphate:Na+ symporter